MNINIDTSFKPIPGFSNYTISSSGKVYSKVRKQFVAVAYNHAGYQTVTITDDNGFRAPRKVHRLVYLAFIGPIKDGMVIDHIDDNKLNNYYMNLQQITPSENSRKSFVSGANKDNVVWTKDEVKQICQMIEANKSNNDIFAELGIEEGAKRNQCQLLIEQLRRGQIHPDIAHRYNFQSYISGINKKDAKFNINEVMDIYMRLMLGENLLILQKNME